MFEYRGFRLGFFCSTSDGKLTTNRRFRFTDLRQDKLLQIVEKNLSDFEELLELSNKLGLGIFRLGSYLVPFISHPKFNKCWLKNVEMILKEFSPTLRRYNIRITMHPGQFSPKFTKPSGRRGILGGVKVPLLDFRLSRC